MRAERGKSAFGFGVWVVVLIAFFFGCAEVEGNDQATPPVLPKIDRRPKSADFKRGVLRSLPKHQANSTDPFEVDLRGYDLSELDMTSAAADLAFSSFDDRTVWPAADRLPKGFDPNGITETGKNPGLGVRSLHAQGITGRGVGIAIIDQPLLVEHREYADRLRFYEEINVLPWQAAQMHGPAVASIAVGRTVGVAPEADLYYIGHWPIDLFGAVFGKERAMNFTYGARAIHRMLEVNEQLPEDRKIRVISISIGWSSSQKGYQEIAEAAAEAKAAGMLVICSSVEAVHGFRFHGLGCDPTGDRDDFNAYRLASWGQHMYRRQDRLLVPMDVRTTASPTGKDEYVFYGQGGWSWSIPYIAGVYALAAQVDPNVAPDQFWALAMKTGRMVQYKGGALGPILDPVTLIAALKAGVLTDPDTVKAELKKYGPTTARRTDIPGKMEQLDVNNATHQDVVALFGPPRSYAWDSETYGPNDLPGRYIMSYSDAFNVFIMRDHVVEVRFDSVDVGYAFRNAIRIGSTLDDVLKVLGPPTETVAGQKIGWQDGILYRDIDGVKGQGYYARADQGVRIFLMNDRVMGLYITRTDPLPGRN
ncbi:MAG: S8 family serine peptidase [Sedimentisphaerales bacterium]|nr:S8 family serine peptidase [Sedimentisphaerales bacterium]HNY80842.1 S8 family serine peptidase [Sedimentisphaerales bacterium]HOC65572.1 S8 family serine peptidase [Sedimentisphaerales bacterium]HOH66705.1 S8 family serine peptidase [Sedimentisphaerales bacterium]HPY48912.1 S8 family serine peptidase [Sedimentisphaerales bacterium]